MKCSLVALTVVTSLALAACASPLLCSVSAGEGEGEGIDPSLDGTVVPAEGGLVPVNAVIHVEVQNAGAPVAASIRVEGEADERALDVDQLATVLRVDPAPLAADTSYVLTLRIAAADAFTAEDLVREVSFTTSAAADDSAPTFAGDATIVVARTSADPCSGQGEGTIATITPPESDDDSEVAGVELFAVEPTGARALLAFALDGRDLVAGQPAGSEASFQLVAVDVAGNESAPLAVDADAGPVGCASACGGAPMAVLLCGALWRRRRGARCA